MSVKCVCPNGNTYIKSFCSDCQQDCTCIEEPTSEQKAVLGLGLAVFLVFLIIQILLLIFMIWFSIHVMTKCKGNPTWLNPTVIALLILWVIIGWFPGIGIALFIALLVILIIYNQKCAGK